MRKSFCKKDELNIRVVLECHMPKGHRRYTGDARRNVEC